jgi:hypothetical protein
MCIGNALDALIVHPDHIIWDAAYIPNHFPVDAIVWNTDANNATSASGTQFITNETTGVANGPIQIISPLPTTNNGYMQVHNMFASDVQAHSSSSITWEDTVLASVLTNCAIDSIYDIAFSVEAAGVGGTSFLTGTCSCPIMVDCQERPPLTPFATVLIRTGSYDGSICNARCINAVAFDTGSVRIPVLSVKADTLKNMTLSIAPNHAGADSTFYSVCVVDSMVDGSAEITVTDTLGNSAIEQYEYCTIADTHAPRLDQILCIDSESCSYQISDTQAWDRGLDTIYFTNVNNVLISPPDSIHGLGVITFNADGYGRFCITAIDLAGNKFDTCFGNTASVSLTPSTPSTLSVSPNPTSGDVSIFISGSPSADVEIFDVLGREVDRFRVNGSYDWETGSLPVGTYIVRAVVSGSDAQPITKRIVKE